MEVLHMDEYEFTKTELWTKRIQAFTKAVYLEKNGARSIRSHLQLFVIGLGSKRKDSQSQNSQRNLFSPDFLPIRKSHRTYQSVMRL